MNPEQKYTINYYMMCKNIRVDYIEVKLHFIASSQTNNIKCIHSDGNSPHFLHTNPKYKTRRNKQNVVPIQFW